MSARTVIFSMKLLIVVSVIVLCGEVAMAQLPSGTPPTTLFQLNGLVGNTTYTGTGSSPNPAALATCTYRDSSGNPVYNQTCDSWNQLNGSGTGSGVLGHADEKSFVDGSLQNFLFKKGTKDILDITGWDFSPDQKAPPKDTFKFGYSAGYTSPSPLNDFVLIFGGDRAAPNGDANIGMWLLQATVVPCLAGGISAITNNADPNCTGRAAGTFSGQHFDHDIFVTSAFTNGGTAPFLNIYEWDGGCRAPKGNAPVPIGGCADDNLRLLGSAASSSLCGSASGCGVVNSVTTNSSWEGDIASPLYFGGGVDVSAALRSAGVTHAPCFASFELETRSSQSSSAELKDFILGGFPECAIRVTKACAPPPAIVTINSVSYVHYAFTGSVINDGGGSLFNLTVVDTFPTGYRSGSGVLNQPTTPAGGLAKGQSATYSGSFDFPDLSDVINHVAASAAASDGGQQTITNDHSGNPAVADAHFGASGSSCSITVTPTLTLDKVCSVGLNPTSNGVVLALNDTITVCNTSSDTAINNITLTNNVLLTGVAGQGTDYGLGTFSLPKQVEGSTANCVTFTPSYLPTQCDGGGPTLTGGRCEFSDTVRISSTPRDQFNRDVPAGAIPSPKGATCHVCPFGACTVSGTP